MTTFKNMNDLAKYINQKVQESMSKGNAVKQVVIEAGERHVQTDVYDVYTPKIYERSGKLKENWNWQDTPDGIEIINTRTDEESGKYIVDTVEYGRNYDYEFEYAHKSRPFIENTKRELSNGNQLSNALRQDMRNNGLNVE